METFTKFMVWYSEWCLRTFHLKPGIDFTIAYLVLFAVVAMVVVGIWKWIKVAFIVVALNVFYEHAGKPKLHHNLKTYFAVSILKKELEEIIR